MKKYSLLFLLCFFWCAFSFAQGDASFSYTQEEALYKIAENGDSLKLDVFLPTGQSLDKKKPVLVMVHGGAWVAGDRSLDHNYYKSQLREKITQAGVAIISISYTLVNDSTHFPRPIEDCKDAVRWVRSHAENYNFDTTNIGLWGESAGAHLALMVAYSGEEDWIGNHAPMSQQAGVSYVINNFGPTDLNTLLQTDAGWFRLFMARIFMRKLLPLRERLAVAITGYSLEAQKDQVVNYASIYSPISFVDSLDVPTLILHGTKDRIVPFNESEKLKKVLDQYGVENELIEVDGGNHGFRNISEERIDVLVDKTLDFLGVQLERKQTL
ncbi:MAG: alpha/beta hydrolase fold domain-containing protein [Sphingobacterium sp.]|uniref:alpha/beta hydrolase n=1 Tax=Sphingobacterium sp. JB170 TaxID=1434842 RepID=UPI00097EB54F|nr:alpha/beta hydrolase [Sphingobacterium sp. JB170]SJN33987.1 Esterase/lipase [Sphingobacterium sp. JB170]